MKDASISCPYCSQQIPTLVTVWDFYTDEVLDSFPPEWFRCEGCGYEETMEGEPLTS